MTPTVLSLVLGALVVGWWLWSVVVGVEIDRGRRIVLGKTRDRLDYGVERVRAVLKTILHYLDRHVIRLSWYYSLHSFLQAALKVVVSLYDYLESSFHHNRKRARAIRAEQRAMRQVRMNDGAEVIPDSHLTSIAEHKVETALTTKQKQKLKSKKLERE